MRTVFPSQVMSIFPTLWYVGAHDMGVSRYEHSTVTAGTQLYLLGGYDETHSLQVHGVLSSIDLLLLSNIAVLISTHMHARAHTHHTVTHSNTHTRTNRHARRQARNHTLINTHSRTHHTVKLGRSQITANLASQFFQR